MPAPLCLALGDQANAATGGVGARLPSTTLDISLGRREDGGSAATKPPARTVVPPLYFRDDFDLRDPATFKEALCSTTSLVLQQKVRTSIAPRMLSLLLITCASR